MKRNSLAAQLGLRVGLMSVALVAAFSAFGYFMLSQGLDRIAKSALESKMTSFSHQIAASTSFEDVKSKSHILVDLAMGHTNLYVYIASPSLPASPLLTIGVQADRFQPSAFPSSNELILKDWQSEPTSLMLTGAQTTQLKDGTTLTVYLTVDRSSDQELLSSLLKWGFASSPLILLIIFIVSWITVRQGLRPLTSFLRVAASISTDNLEHRLPTTGLPSELRQLADGINFMLHRLDNGVQQLSQFSDDLAHELRSPIANLMGKAQVALSRGRTSEEYREVLESCTEELDRVTRIVSDMLFLAQVSHPAALVHFEPVCLQDELERVKDLFLLTAEEKDVEISVTGRGTVRGNRLMIQRAISNLLSNAIRYCPAGSTVGMHIEQNSSVARLSVGNPGSGIAPEHLPHLFERFYRVDKSRARSEGGTGLGLAIVHSIMSLHQGTAGVSVDQDGRTCFYLDFQLKTND
ncbi:MULTISPECIES: heavy metal sensor histidine kinase [Pseudomonas]|uniref:heavy metal sensor histidine kinase n=1 Tax=Pseudomonas TaxID=286 RepID=UPI001C80AE57|nr:MULTISPECIES: heavy metal sensor histidine kinase [Pseudomonas]MDH0897599.1 heavy metal sensor histidine kinase [Pseudomonas sp. GD03875]MDH1067629.1 heavy metal sensor histidine kinase [Pseudomonas sp. GD03985]